MKVHKYGFIQLFVDNVLCGAIKVKHTSFFSAYVTCKDCLKKLGKKWK